MKIELRKNGNTVILDIEGKIIVGEGKKIINFVKKVLLSGEKNVVFNLEKVNHIDSFGLGTIVSVYSIVTNQKGKFFLLNPTKRILELLDITKLHKAFQIFDSEENLTQSLG